MNKISTSFSVLVLQCIAVRVSRNLVPTLPLYGDPLGPGHDESVMYNRED